MLFVSELWNVVDVFIAFDDFHGDVDMNITDTMIESSMKKLEDTLKRNNLFESYDDLMTIQAAIIERNRKIKGQSQTIKNMELKIGRMCDYKYGH